MDCNDLRELGRSTDGVIPAASNHGISYFFRLGEGCSRRCPSNPALVGRQMLANLEYGLDSVFRVDLGGDIAGGQFTALLLAQEFQDLMLEFDYLCRSLFTGFNPGLMISVDVDKRGIKSDCAFK